MPALLRFSLLVFVGLSAHQTLQRLDPHYQQNLVPGICALPGLSVELRQDLLENRDLEARAVPMRERIERKQALAQDVIAERISLLEAAACYQQLDRERTPAQRARVREVYQARTDAQRYCLEVVSAIMEEAVSRGQQRELQQRFDAELECLFGAGPILDVPAIDRCPGG